MLLRRLLGAHPVVKVYNTVAIGLVLISVVARVAAARKARALVKPGDLDPSKEVKI